MVCWCCTSLENENRKNLLFSNLASENWVNWVKLKLYQNALKAEGFDDKAAQVDSDAGRLNIELPNFGSLTIDDDIFAGHIADDLERRIIEQDTLE